MVAWNISECFVSVVAIDCRVETLSQSRPVGDRYVHESVCPALNNRGGSNRYDVPRNKVAVHPKGGTLRGPYMSTQAWLFLCRGIVHDLLELRQKTLGPDHPEVATHLNNLTFLYGEQGRYADAEALYLRALVIMRKARGTEYPDVATELNNLAGVYRSQGRYPEAENLYSQCLAIWEKALGPQHPDVAIALSNLAGLYGIQGKYQVVRDPRQISKGGTASPTRIRYQSKESQPG